MHAWPTRTHNNIRCATFARWPPMAGCVAYGGGCNRAHTAAHLVLNGAELGTWEGAQAKHSQFTVHRILVAPPCICPRQCTTSPKEHRPSHRRYHSRRVVGGDPPFHQGTLLRSHRSTRGARDREYIPFHQGTLLQPWLDLDLDLDPIQRRQ